MLLMGVVSKKNAEHYVWGGDCDGWYLVKNDSLNVIEERLPPGRVTKHVPPAPPG